MPFLKILAKRCNIQSDFPFRSDDSYVVLPWIIAFMVYLAAIFLSMGVNFGTALAGWNHYYTNSITLQITAPKDASEAATRTALDTLAQLDGIEKTTVLDAAKVRAMVEPWIGHGGLLDTLPLPIVIEATLAEGNSIDAAAVESLLATKLDKASIEVDDHQAWIAKFASLIRSSQWIAFAIVGVIVAVTLAIIVMATRTELKLHRRTLELLHSIGARDAYIAKQFQTNALVLTAKGAIPGALLAAATLWAVGRLADGLDAPFLPLFALSPQHWLTLFLTVIAAGFIAFISARITVIRTIGKLV